MADYLDYTGLQHYDEKIKQNIPSIANANAGSYMTWYGLNSNTTTTIPINGAKVILVIIASNSEFQPTVKQALIPIAGVRSLRSSSNKWQMPEVSMSCYVDDTNLYLTNNADKNMVIINFRIV